MANAHGGKVMAVYDAVLSGFAIELPEQAAEALARNPKVRYIEEAVAVEVSSETSTSYQPTSGDPQNGLWHLDRVDERQIDDGGLDGFYGRCAEGEGVTAYIVDTGIRRDHQEFAPGQVLDGVDFSGGDAGTATDPCSPSRMGDNANGYHGTAVASILGGQTFGVAKGVSLVPVRVLGCVGSGDNAFVYQGLNWILTNGRLPAVINMSFYFKVQQNLSSLREILDQLHTAGYVIVVSANNKGLDPDPALREACSLAPASFARAMGGPVITAGGTQVGEDGNGLTPPYDYRDFRWPRSSWGTCVDLWAPAAGVRIAHYETTDATSLDHAGTSFSSPIVAGVAARYLEYFPDSSPSAVWNWLSESVDETSSPEGATTLNSSGMPLIGDVRTTPHTRMVHFRDDCRARPVQPCQPISITKQPLSYKLPNASRVTLEVEVSHTPPNTRYQWYRGDTPGWVTQPIYGAIYPTYTIDPVNNANASYWVRVSTDCNIVDSQVATITHTLFCPDISIDSQPQGGTILEGASITLSVGATSENPLSYQWQGNFPIPNPTESSITVSPTQLSAFQAVVNNGCRTRYSNWTYVYVAKEHLVSLRTYYSNYVGADGCGGSGVHAYGSWVGACEKFILRDLNGGQIENGDSITLRSANGPYLVAEWGGGPGQTVNADRATAGPWETFTIWNMGYPGPVTNGSQVALQTSGGYYVVAEYGGINGGGPGAGDVNCDRTEPHEWETFEITWE